MKWIITGLGNPGPEYSRTRHNAGRIVLEQIVAAFGAPELQMKRSYKGLASSIVTDDGEVVFIAPETYMNNSGASLLTLVKSKKAAAQLVVVYDDLDLPLGVWKISWNRGTGGHNGIDSIQTVLKTKEFIRIRIGISPKGEDGVTKKPKGDERVNKFVLGKFTKKEEEEIYRIAKEVAAALPVLLRDGLEVAMNKWN